MSVADEDILQEISDEDLPALRDIYKEYWPSALHAYYWVDNYIDWKKKGITNIVFLCPEGRWDDGTFIAVETNEFLSNFFIFSLEKSCSRLQKALATTKKIDWNKKFIFFGAVHENHQEALKNVIINKNKEISHQDISNMWWIPKEEAIKYKFEIPPEVYLDALKEEDVEIIDPVWPHRGSFSKAYLSKLITTNGGFGLYSKTDNSLCAWIMRNNYGGMAILQTAEEHKRKGYGEILAKYFSKYWGEKGLDIFCFIMTHNTPSLNLFKKLGYRKEHSIIWYHVPNN